MSDTCLFCQKEIGDYHWTCPNCGKLNLLGVFGPLLFVIPLVVLYLLFDFVKYQFSIERITTGHNAYGAYTFCQTKIEDEYKDPVLQFEIPIGFQPFKDATVTEMSKNVYKVNIVTYYWDNPPERHSYMCALQFREGRWILVDIKTQ